MKGVIIVPTYNEADNILPLIAGIHSHCPDADILVVDDASPDGTADLAQSVDHVRVLRRQRKMGLGSAYIDSFTSALNDGYEFIACMDADLSHDPAVLPVLFGLLVEHDLSIGARYIPGGAVRNWQFHRRALSSASNALSRQILGLPVRDCTSGFRAYRNTLLEAIDLSAIHSNGFAFQVEVLYRAVQKGFRVAETPITFQNQLSYHDSPHAFDG